MRFKILSKRSLGLVLFCFKRVNILTPLVFSIDVLLTINMSKTNTSTSIYSLDTCIYIWKDRVLFSCKNRYLGYSETSAITRTLARSRRYRYSRVPLYTLYDMYTVHHLTKQYAQENSYITMSNLLIFFFKKDNSYNILKTFSDIRNIKYLFNLNFF